MNLGASGTFVPNNTMALSMVGTPDPRAWSSNPQMTIPGTMPVLPLAQYSTPPVPLVFSSPFAAASSGGDVPPVSSSVWGEIGSDDPAQVAAYSRRVRLRALWASPVFDIRPELKASTGEAPGGMPISRVSGIGGAPVLIVQMRRGSDATYSERFYNYQAQERTALTNVDNMITMHPPVSITTAVQSSPIVSNASTVRERSQHVFVPPGNARFWQVIIVVDVVANGADASPAVFHELQAWAG